MKTSGSLRQQGLSLVELMIALAISTLLILGITQIFIDNKRNYVFQRNQINLLENARYAELLLNEYLAKAGYRRAADDNPEFAFPAVAANSDCLAFTSGSAVTATTDKKGICLRYQPLVSGEPDCLGAATTTFTDSIPFTSPGPSTLITIAIKHVENSALDAGSLICKNVGTGLSAAMLNNVADMRLEFGVGANVSSRELVAGSNRFTTAGDWTTNTGPIRAVRFSILMASPANQRDGDSQIFTDWLATADNTRKAALLAGDQGRLYQVVGSTRTIRNFMP